MRNRCPETLQIKGRDYVLQRILKEDFFSVNGLYVSEGQKPYVLKISDFRFIGGTLLRPFAIFMSRHEHKMYSLVQDLQGIPEIGGRFGSRGFLHEFVEGITLVDVEEKGLSVPEGFFDELLDIVQEMHRRGLIFMDLNKYGNIILGEDGHPHLIDFQISVLFRSYGFPLGRFKRRLFSTLAQEDIYHVFKHKKNRAPEQMRPNEFELATRSKANERMTKFLGRPYRKLKRRIYPQDSNDTVWYKWKKDRAARTD